MNDASIWWAEKQRLEELRKLPPCEDCDLPRVKCKCPRCLDCDEVLDGEERGHEQCFSCYAAERDD